MNRELFGTDGVRGKAGQYPLDDKTVGQIGLAIAKQFGQPGAPILLGRDPRQSSPHISQVLAAAITDGGPDVKNIGVITTPGLAYLTRESDASAGVMITASHNPYPDNGIKVFTAKGEKLTDQQEVALNTAIGQTQPAKKAGKQQKAEELIAQYEDFLVESADGAKLGGMSVIIDSANGSASGIAERVFNKLGAKVTAIFDQPDGKNINEGCGATNLKALKQKVGEAKVDVGIALDGDADRLLLVDSQGREVNGDHILYILAVAGNHKGVVATVMSNFGFEKSLGSRSIELVRTAVGDRYVMDGLRDSGYKLGGEQSGHIIMADLLSTGDGLLAAIQTLAAVKASGKSLAEWRDEVTMLPQFLINVELKDDKPAAELLAEFSRTETDNLEGQGRVLVRASGTELLLRVMVEGDSAEDIAETVVKRLKQKLGIS